MNAQGYGVVSLYHTLIKQLQTNEWSQANAISQSIINLPVHQDIQDSELEEMCAAIRRFFEKRMKG
jgi:dTDP-4-amino-4,6-dideoxygalactose transaminase